MALKDGYRLSTTTNQGVTVRTPPMPLAALLTRAEAAGNPRECKRQAITYVDLQGQERIYVARVSQGGKWLDWAAPGEPWIARDPA